MRNVANKIIGSKFFHEDCNSMASEEENLVLTSGQTLVEADSYQISKAAAIYAASSDFYVDSGTANNYILSAIGTRQTPIAYVDGMRIRFRTSNPNTGTSTVNVAALGVKTIKKEDGIFDLGAGDIPANHVNELVYNASTGFFELYSHKYENQVFRTGWWTFAIDVVAPPGWIIYGNIDQTQTTIGDASSGALVRANADCEALFKLIWIQIIDLYCPVIGGRGVSADADWNAHKQICLPYLYGGRSFACLNAYTSNGYYEGQRTQSFGAANNASHSHSFSYSNPLSGTGEGVHGNDGASQKYPQTTTSNTGATGSNAPFSVIPPTIYFPVIMKL